MSASKEAFEQWKGKKVTFDNGTKEGIVVGYALRQNKDVPHVLVNCEYGCGATQLNADEDYVYASIPCPYPKFAYKLVGYLTEIKEECTE